MKQGVVGVLAIVMLAVGASSASANLVVGGPGDDVLEGTPGPDVIWGRGGNDTLTGGGDGDVLLGCPGNDRARLGQASFNRASFDGGGYPSIDNSCWRIESVTLDNQGPGCKP